MTKSLLYVVTSFNPFRKDGMANRVQSFTNCFKRKDYKVTIIACTNAFESYKVIKQKKILNKDVDWYIMPYFNSYDHRILNNIIWVFQKKYVKYIADKVKPTYILADTSAGVSLCELISNKYPVIGNYRADELDELKTRYRCDNSDKIIEYARNQLKQSLSINTHSICVSKNLRDTIEKQSGMSFKHNFIFPCCADINRFTDVKPDLKNEQIVLGYFGGLHKWQCVEEVIKIAIELKKIDKRYHLLILTQSPHNQLDQLLKELGHDNYTIKSATPQDIPFEISKMDVSFALREDLSLNRVSSPTKLSESLAAGVPLVVTPSSGDYKEIVSEKTGLVLSSLSFSQSSISQIHNFCMNVKEKRMDFFNDCREMVKERTWEDYANHFIDFIEGK